MKRMSPEPSPPEYKLIQKNSHRTQFFGMILYPDEDLFHKAVIEYIKNHENYYKYIMIYHDGEPDEEENQKKNHVHLMYKKRNRSTPLAELKYWCGNVKHIEPITCPESYALYMIHDTFSCDMENKKRYSVDDVEGSQELKRAFYGIDSVFLHF